MIRLLLLVAFFTGTASADDWICRTQSSVQRGNSVLACGVGEATTEADARREADENAIDQFQRGCSTSDECRNHRVVSKPGRTECEVGIDSIKCYRAIAFEIEEGPSDLNVEIESQKRTLAQLEEKKSQQEGLEEVKSEIKFAGDNPSYWSLGVGVSVGDTRYNGIASLQVGYGFNFRRCFADIFCPTVGANFGTIKVDETSSANFAQGYAGAQLYVYRRLYLHGGYGLEYQWNASSMVLGPTLTGGIGIDAVRVKSVSISIETGVKGGPGTQVNLNSGAAFNFKF